MSDKSWISIFPMESGFKVFKSRDTVQFCYFFRDKEFNRWIQGEKFVLPLEIAQKVLKPEFLEVQNEKEKKNQI